VLRLLAWIVRGDGAFQEPDPDTDRNWYRRKSGAFGLLLRAPMWIGVAVFLTAALGYLGIPAILEIMKWLAGLPLLADTGVDRFFEALERGFAGLSLLERMLRVLVAGAAIVTLAGAVRRFLEREPRNRGAAS
jgi:hypothetical protein